MGATILQKDYRGGMTRIHSDPWSQSLRAANGTGYVMPTALEAYEAPVHGRGLHPPPLSALDADILNSATN